MWAKTPFLWVNRTKFCEQNLDFYWLNHVKPPCFPGETIILPGETTIFPGFSPAFFAGPRHPLAPALAQPGKLTAALPLGLCEERSAGGARGAAR